MLTHLDPNTMLMRLKQEPYPLQAEVDKLTSSTTELMSRKPADYTFGGNCGVLSVAICAGVSFEEAKAACRLKTGSKGGTTHFQRENALKALGVQFETRVHGDYSPTRIKRMRVATFARDWAIPGVTYMLRIRGHVVTCLNGIVMDQSSVAPAVHHPYAKSIVTRSTKIISKE